VEYALKKGDKYIASAKNNFNKLPDSVAKKDLFTLVDYFTARKY
jgi:hypothetical protein